MRYYQQPDILFTLGNRQVIIKEPLPPTVPTLTSNVVRIDGQSSLDEIASRAGTYGEGSEPLCYQIFEENIVEIFESRFDLNRMVSVRVP